MFDETYSLQGPNAPKNFIIYIKPLYEEINAYYTGTFFFDFF